MQGRCICSYGPIKGSLSADLAKDWQVEILPWVVGVCGLVDTQPVHRVLELLLVPRERWGKITQDVAIESVKL